MTNYLSDKAVAALRELVRVHDAPGILYGDQEFLDAWASGIAALAEIDGAAK